MISSEQGNSTRNMPACKTSSTRTARLRAMWEQELSSRGKLSRVEDCMAQVATTTQPIIKVAATTTTTESTPRLNGW